MPREESTSPNSCRLEWLAAECPTARCKQSSTYNGADRFTYTISDGKGATTTGTNYVNVGSNGLLIVY